MSVSLSTSELPNFAHFNEICAVRDPAAISRQFETGAMPQDLSNCDFPRNEPTPVLRVIQSFSAHWKGIYGCLDNGDWRQDLRTSAVSIEEDTREYDITIKCLEILFKHNIGKNRIYSWQNGAIGAELVEYSMIAEDRRHRQEPSPKLIPDFWRYFIANGLDLSKDSGVWETSPLRKAVGEIKVPTIEFLAYNGAFLPENIGSKFVKRMDGFFADNKFTSIVVDEDTLRPCRICKAEDSTLALMGKAIFINCLIRLRMCSSSPFPEHFRIEARSFTKKILPEIQLKFKDNVLPDVFTIRGVNDIIGSYFTDSPGDPLIIVNYCEEEAENLEIVQSLVQPHMVNGRLNRNAIVISNQILFDSMLKRTITIQDLFDVGLLIDVSEEDHLVEAITEGASCKDPTRKTIDSLTRLPRKLPIGFDSLWEPELPKESGKASKRRHRRKLSVLT